MADKLSRGLTVRVDVDVADAITGLKAVQREARKATQALREVERLSSGVFSSGDSVRWDFGTQGGLFRCICADISTAVFAPTWDNGEGGLHTEYRDMFAVSNDKTITESIAGKYEIIA